VLELASGLEVIRLDELEYDGTNVLGEPKHWHTGVAALRKFDVPDIGALQEQSRVTQLRRTDVATRHD